MLIHRYVILKAAIQHNLNTPLCLDQRVRKLLAREMIINSIKIQEKFMRQYCL